MPRQQKVRIEVVAPVNRVTVEGSRANKVILRLARLVGRQMAREDFGRRQARLCARQSPDRERPSKIPKCDALEVGGSCVREDGTKDGAANLKGFTHRQPDTGSTA